MSSFVPTPSLEDMIGVVGRTVTWLQHAMDQQVRVRAADAAWAARELETLTAVLHLLEDLRHGAQMAPTVQVSVERSRQRRRA